MFAWLYMYMYNGAAFSTSALWFFSVTRQISTGVAFTVYLDHIQTGLGADQVIVYNRVVLNYGNAFHSNTGKFSI